MKRRIRERCDITLASLMLRRKQEVTRQNVCGFLPPGEQEIDTRQDARGDARMREARKARGEKSRDSLAGQGLSPEPGRNEMKSHWTPTSP